MRSFLGLTFAVALVAAAADQPVFNSKGELAFPADYREWVYLSSGLGMTYGPAAGAAGAASPLFDNVFVNRSGYEQFKETGKWPDGTMFVLEIRYSTSHGSILKGGTFQTDAAALEVEVKDSKRFANGWGFFDFGGGLSPRAASAPLLGPKASCYSCHDTNGAVENTFTQFYPVALAIARAKGTVKPSYQERSQSPVAVVAALREGKTEPAVVLGEIKAAEPGAAALTERNLNAMGHSLLRAGAGSQAVGVLEWAASTYPASANAQDSLAEAYESTGQTAKALETSRRALALLEKDPAAANDRHRALKAAIEGRIKKLAEGSR